VIENKVHNTYGVCVHRECAAALSQTLQLNRRNNMLVKNLETFCVCVCVCAAYSKWLWYDLIGHMLNEWHGLCTDQLLLHGVVTSYEWYNLTREV
jgi:hypothetical protein